MGEWLSAYREGRWRTDSGQGEADERQGEIIRWTSPTVGTLRTGRLLLACSGKWLLVMELESPNPLIWLREELVQR